MIGFIPAELEPIARRIAAGDRAAFDELFAKAPPDVQQEIRSLPRPFMVALLKQWLSVYDACGGKMTVDGIAVALHQELERQIAEARRLGPEAGLAMLMEVIGALQARAVAAAFGGFVAVPR